jgi:hypothetical protein
MKNYLLAISLLLNATMLAILWVKQSGQVRVAAGEITSSPHPLRDEPTYSKQTQSPLSPPFNDENITPETTLLSPTSDTKFAIPPSGVLPSEAARELGLSTEQTKLVQIAVNNFRKVIEERVGANAYYDESLSDPSTARDVYRIPALLDGGEALRTELKGRLEEIVGRNTAALLWSDSYIEPYAGYGRYDVLIEFTPNQEFIDAGISPDAILAKYQYTDPKTGNPVLEGTRTLESFTSIFGNWNRPKK